MKKKRSCFYDSIRRTVVDIAEFARVLFEDHKFMRRVILFWWMGIFTIVTLFKVEFDNVSYSTLAALSGAMFIFYFHKRGQEENGNSQDK